MNDDLGSWRVLIGKQAWHLPEGRQLNILANNSEDESYS
jgi:hypothetical protein